MGLGVTQFPLMPKVQPKTTDTHWNGDGVLVAQPMRELCFLASQLLIFALRFDDSSQGGETKVWAA